jgi:hypothetical protein
MSGRLPAQEETIAGVSGIVDNVLPILEQDIHEKVPRRFDTSCADA